ncbi:carbohydrate sulfotransferase 6-like [Penaeus indicus]|uniref:carbohydrate sulfotransferase 6-like n=1 Tax=Penaeus indicus TaxID=29960 RepID=UPI00300D981C
MQTYSKSVHFQSFLLFFSLFSQMFPRRISKICSPPWRFRKLCFLLLLVVLVNVLLLNLLPLDGTKGRRQDLADGSFRNLSTGPRAAGPRRKAVVLFSRWRSGSTFMGEVLKKAGRGVFYSYEPLYEYGVHVLYEDIEETHLAVEEVKHILRCQFDFGKIEEMLRSNPLLREACKTSGICKDANHTAEVCRKSSLHVAKVLRLGLRWARPLLEMEDVDVKLIYLVRDPRAVFSSRAKVAWCSTPTCKDVKTVCSLLEDDLLEASLLQEDYPTRFHFILYDRFCQTPLAALQKLMGFLGLPVTRDQEKILQSKLPSMDALSIYKNSSAQAQLWRKRTSFTSVVMPIQRWCWTSLENLGLRMFFSEKDLGNMSLPVVLQDGESRGLKLV